MTTQDTVRTVICDYFESWTRGDMSRARTHLADDLDFICP